MCPSRFAAWRAHARHSERSDWPARTPTRMRATASALIGRQARIAAHACASGTLQRVSCKMAIEVSRSTTNSSKLTILMAGRLCGCSPSDGRHRLRDPPSPSDGHMFFSFCAQLVAVICDPVAYDSCFNRRRIARCGSRAMWQHVSDRQTRIRSVPLEGALCSPHGGGHLVAKAPARQMVDLSVGQSVGRSIGRLVGLSVGRSVVGLSVGRSVGLSVGRSVGRSFGGSVGRSGTPHTSTRHEVNSRPRPDVDSLQNRSKVSIPPTVVRTYSTQTSYVTRSTACRRRNADRKAQFNIAVSARRSALLLRALLAELYLSRQCQTIWMMKPKAGAPTSSAEMPAEGDGGSSVLMRCKLHFSPFDITLRRSAAAIDRR